MHSEQLILYRVKVGTLPSCFKKKKRKKGIFLLSGKYKKRGDQILKKIT